MKRLTNYHFGEKSAAYMVCSGTCTGDILCEDCAGLERIIARLAAYEDAMPLELAQEIANDWGDGWPEELKAYWKTGLTPEDVTNLMAAHGTAILELSEYRKIGTKKHLWELAQAEKDGRLVVLPCKEGDELLSNGLTFRADHWNVLLTSFAECKSVPSDKRVKLFYPEEAEAALKKREAGNESDP